MLPPGHLASGFLAGKIVSLVIPEFNEPKVLLFTSLFGILPDLDFFYAFFKARRFISREDINHRTFVTHTPLLYLAVFLIWYWLFPSTQIISIAFFVGAWSHFLVDTLGSDGIAWFYPFSSKFYKICKEDKIIITEQSFWKHWIVFIKKFYFKTIISRYEIMLVVIAILLFFYF